METQKKPGAKKPVLYAEASYVLGMVILALGTALMERADFGMSMVVAPAYLLHLKFSPALPFLTFGMAEYLLQGALLVVMMLLLRRVRKYYFFSFITAVLYGLTLDLCIALAAPLPAGGLVLRTVYYVLGMVLGSIGVALFLRTYIAPEVYELLVKELSAARHMDVGMVKTAYDCISCAASVAMSFAFFGFGHFEGVKAGTIVCALVNGTLISLISRWLGAHFDERDALPLRRFFKA